jgi:hypothetical protein
MLMNIRLLETVGVPAEIRKQQLPNISVERYHFINQTGNAMIWGVITVGVAGPIEYNIESY